MDPVSCVTLAAGAYKTLKAAISTGKDIQDMGSALATWGQAFSDFTNLEERTKNPPWWQQAFKGSDEETALEIFAHKKKMESMRKEIKDHISFHYGPSAWEEVLRIEAAQRRKRKEEVYRKQQLIDNLINITIGSLFFAAGLGGLLLVLYFIGKQQGKW